MAGGSPFIYYQEVIVMRADNSKQIQSEVIKAWFFPAKIPTELRKHMETITLLDPYSSKANKKETQQSGRPGLRKGSFFEGLKKGFFPKTEVFY